MIADYEDDDAHFCLKCHNTIIGLENYINHRKTACSKSIEGPPKSPLPSQLLPPDESFNLKADDFFSSLELRSSSKKPETQSTSGKSFTGILTRSRTTAVIQATLGNQKSISEPSQSKSGKNVWIGGHGHQEKELGNEDNHSKLIKAVDNLERGKEDPPICLQCFDESDDESEEYDYDQDDSSSDDQDIPPRHHTGGKWKPSSPIHWSKNTDRDWNIPPPSYTGGKWKPNTKQYSNSPASHTKGKRKPENPNKDYFNAPPPSFTGGKYIASKRQDYQDLPPPGHTKGKWKPKMDNEEDVPPPNYTKGKWKLKGEPDQDFPPPTHTKGKWKPKSEEDFPPSSHTKGKWKPKVDNEDFPPTNQVKGKWKPKSSHEDFPPADHTKGKWKPKGEPYQNFPPPSHTKGKWNPKVECDEMEDILTLSPAKRHWKSVETDLEHLDTSKPKANVLNKSSKSKKRIETDEVQTKGKWASTPRKKELIDISSLRKSNGSVQYWCNPCNRMLASKIVYERHLKSELHFKRTLHDREFDDGEELSILKNVKRPKVKPPETIFSDHLNILNGSKHRNRRKKFIRCGVCQSKVNKYLIGKHLISHYHCRKGDITTPQARQMVLDHIHEIVVEHPFQCSICKFYCNTQEEFLKHWLSKDHCQRIVPGYFFCILCKYRSEDTQQMHDHLVSPGHNEVISVINRSVPIVIKKIIPIHCLTCQKKFTLNIQLLKHCEQFNHDISHVKKAKMEFICDSCGVGFLTNISLKRHKKKVHKEVYYVCTPCDLKFNSIKEAITHRRTAEHKYNVVSRTSDKENLKKKCSICDASFNNFLLLKEHLNYQHPEHKIRCPHCGSSFAIAQELTTHLRLKQCKFEENPENSLRCEKCPFSTNSSSELLFHVALHGDPIKTFPPNDAETKSKPTNRYKCPICDKYFPKTSLLGHIRQHTQEKPFKCKVCGKTFGRKNNLQYHMNVHKKNSSKPKPPVEASEERLFSCSTCGSSFKKKGILQQHMVLHTGKRFKCPATGCIYTARRLSELNIHHKTHSEIREFTCDICDYKGKTKQHLTRHMIVHTGVKKFECNQCSFLGRNSFDLKRHIRIHTGIKPYHCPYCGYQCNNIENLRKHVLSTNKHPGKSMYECKMCTFRSNFAKQFKVHLMTEHSKAFANPAKTSSYIAGIYEVRFDNRFLTEEEDDQSDRRIKPSSSMGNASDQSDHIKKLKTDADPVVCQVSGIPSTSKDQSLDVMPMLIIPKDDCASYSWNLVGSYDVKEESGTLIPFHSDGESLFEEHF